MSKKYVFMALAAGLTLSLQGVAEAAPSKGGTPLVSVVTPAVVISPDLIVVTPAAVGATAFAPPKGGTPTTGSPVFIPPGISPIPPLPPSPPKVGP